MIPMLDQDYLFDKHQQFHNYFKPNNRQLQKSKKQQQRSLSPWIPFTNTKQIVFEQPKKDKHQFLSNIIVRTKNKSSPNTVKISLNASLNASFQNYQPKNSLTPSKATSKKYWNMNRVKHFSSERYSTKQEMQQARESKIVELNLAPLEKVEIILNPENFLDNHQNWNPYLRNRNKKELQRFKIKHHTILNSLYQQKRGKTLHNYLKLLEDQSRKKRTTHKQKNNYTINIEKSMHCQGQNIKFQPQTYNKTIKTEKNSNQSTFYN